MKSLFFCPVYNQYEELPALCKEIEETRLPCNEFLFVNNGSKDGSQALIQKSGFPYLDFAQNKGIGFAFIKAIDWALERGFEVIGVIAGNGKMLPAEMHTVLNPILQNEVDLVTGSRFLNGGAFPNLPTFRRFSIPMVNIIAGFLSGAKLTDSTCGYRAFRLEILKYAEFDWHAPWLYTYGFEYYIYAKVILEHQLRWKEVPVTMRYPGTGKRYTKIRPGLDWWRMLEPWIRARFDGKGFNSGIARCRDN